MTQHQDKSKNALTKSHEAAFGAWVEELRADQSQFLSEKILCPGVIHFVFILIVNGEHYHVVLQHQTTPRAEKEGAKTRAKLIRQLED